MTAVLNLNIFIKDYELNPSTTTSNSVLLSGEEAQFNQALVKEGTTVGDNKTETTQINSTVFVVPASDRTQFNGTLADGDYLGDGFMSGYQRYDAAHTAQVFSDNKTYQGTDYGWNRAFNTENLAPGDRVCSTMGVQPWSSRLRSTSGWQEVGGWNAWRYSKPVCATVAKSPSLHLQGSDSWSGISTNSGGFEGGKALNRVGSFSQYGLWSMGVIDGNFGSAGWTSSNTGSASKEKALKFANKEQPYGRFTTSTHAISGFYDYYNNRSGVTDVYADNINLTNLNSGVYRYYGSSGLRISGNVGVGKNVVIINANNVDVNVVGDVNYASSGITNIANIPSLTVVTRNNIKVMSSVNALAGLWTTTGGTFYSCGDASVSGSASTDFNVTAKCDRKLVINGAIIANQTRWWRTAGPNNLSEQNNAGKLPAEVVRYHPGLYLQNYAQTLKMQRNLKTIMLREVAPRW
jgi:hypothetical protein